MDYLLTILILVVIIESILITMLFSNLQSLKDDITHIKKVLNITSDTSINNESYALEKQLTEQYIVQKSNTDNNHNLDESSYIEDMMFKFSQWIKDVVAQT